MSKQIFLDTETTGLGALDRIIQLGYFVVANNMSTEVINEFCNPQVAIGIEAMEIHNVTADMLDGKPLCVDTHAYQYLGELNNANNYLIIHNARFDLGMLNKEGFVNQMQVIDTQRCAKHLFQDEKYHRLQYLRYSLELYKYEKQEAESLGVHIKAHDAIGDVLIMKLLTNALVTQVKTKFPNEDPMQKLAELTEQPIFITKPLRFGKHKGKTLQELVQVDRSYLDWMVDKMNLDDDMLFTITSLINKQE